MILAIESSCDESAVALFDPAKGMAGEWVHSQVALHSEHGGVVPDIATREHLRHFGPLLEKARASAEWPAVTGVAVTRGPGLAACLAVGAAAAKAVARARRLPVCGVNHLRAHAWSPFIPVHEGGSRRIRRALRALLPHLGLIVSGGNTILFSLSAERVISRISATRDDAAGEALDKGAKLLGIGYPGGPALERLATGGKAAAYDFPRGIGKKGDLDFSFSGLKYRALRYSVIQAMAEAGGKSVALSRTSAPATSAAVVDRPRERASARRPRRLGDYRRLQSSGSPEGSRTTSVASRSAIDV